MFLHGSLTLGDYVPRRSDVDLLAIVERPLLDEERERLARAVVAEQPVTPGPLDVRVITAAAAAQLTEAPPIELYLRHEPPSSPAVERRSPGEPDLVVELSVCREHGRSLCGSGPSELIGEVPDEWVLSYGDSLLAGWQSLTDDVEHAELMVLTACRIWRFHDERIHCAKSAAGARALNRDPSLRAVRGALDQRRLRADATIEPAEVVRLLALVRGKLATLERPGRPSGKALDESTRTCPRAGSSAARSDPRATRRPQAPRRRGDLPRPVRSR